MERKDAMCDDKYRHLLVNICTTMFNIQQFYVLPTQCIYVFYVDLRTNSINWLVCITETQCVYCAVRTGSLYTGYKQKNGAVSKVNKKFISHLTWAQRTPSAAATVQVSNALITVLQCMHPGSHDTHTHGNQIQCCHHTRSRPGLLPLHKNPDSTNCRYHLVMLFLCGASFLNHAQNSRCTVITDLDTSKRSTQKAFSCCGAILETDPAAPQ